MGDQVQDPAPESNLASLQALNSQHRKTLMDTIDNLKELGIDKYVDLPQIIVVGDQSSGKSSVLEAISGVSFPASGGTCTRFATELVLRRAAESKMAVSIRSADTGNSSAFDKGGLNPNDLGEIIEKARDKIMLGTRAGTNLSFSKDVLRIELCRPDLLNLTLVDLPGFFHSATSQQSSPEDKALVNQLGLSYMKQPNSIILTVVAADQQLANQAVLDLAKEQDPRRERTIGVITKPDIPPPGSHNQTGAITLAKNLEPVHHLKLGWYVLRNRSEGQDSSFEERNLQEAAFFESGSWSSISPLNRGVESLQKRLSSVLQAHIEETLPDVLRSIEQQLTSRQDELQQLGPDRSTVQHHRVYLHRIFQEFNRLAEDGVLARYGDKFFGELDLETDGAREVGAPRARNLRSLLRMANCTFVATMVEKGAAKRIDWGEDEDEEEEEEEEEEEDAIRTSGSADSTPTRPKSRQPNLRKYAGLYQNIPDPEEVSVSDILRDLEKDAAETQGREYPGLPSAEATFRYFKSQTKPWDRIASTYLDHVLEISRVFVEDLLEYIIGPDKRTLDAVLSGYIEPFFDGKKATLRSKVEELLRPYTEPYGPALEEEFTENVFRSPKSAMNRRLASINAGGGGSTAAKGAKFSQFGSQFTVRLAETHYTMALRTFSENVIHLAAESCLIQDIPRILTPSMVLEMKEERLEKLASESEDVKSKRQYLQVDIERLKYGLKICQKYKPAGRTQHSQNFTTKTSSSVSKSPSGPQTSETGLPSVSLPPFYFGLDNPKLSKNTYSGQGANEKQTTGGFGTLGGFGSPLPSRPKSPGGLFGAGKASPSGPPVFSKVSPASISTTSTKPSSGGLFGSAGRPAAGGFDFNSNPFGGPLPDTTERNGLPK